MCDLRNAFCIAHSRCIADHRHYAARSQAVELDGNCSIISFAKLQLGHTDLEMKVDFVISPP